ncbi:TIR domain-containing protein [Microlunatus phosphovorus]|uniref:TIR domain-containing protein n=1 Tax=Microlunatus phosphovorus TaxID=29405 RepID=UPI00155AADE3
MRVLRARQRGKIAPLVEALQATGIRLWMDVEDIRPATEWIHEIEAGITKARASWPYSRRVPRLRCMPTRTGVRP